MTARSYGEARSCLPARIWHGPSLGCGIYQVYCIPVCHLFQRYYTQACQLYFENRQYGRHRGGVHIGQVAASPIYILTKNAKEVAEFPHDHLQSATKLEPSSNKITVGPGKIGYVHVSLTASMADELRRLPYHSGYVTINCTDGSALSVPYQHIGTELQSVRAMSVGATSLRNWRELNHDADSLCSPEARYA